VLISSDVQLSLSELIL